MTARKAGLIVDFGSALPGLLWSTPTPDPTGPDQLHLSWGTLPDWIQIVANVLLILAAFITIVGDRVRIRRLEAAQAEAVVDEARMRVSGVCAWPEDWSRRDVRVTCRNGTDEPIYDVIARASATALDDPPQKLEMGTKSSLLMRPGEEIQVNIDFDELQADAPFVDVVFRHPTLGRWWRKASGILEPLDIGSHH
jgi:hypothetical protein